MKQILYFSLGAAIGSGIAWYFTKRYYKQMLTDVMEDVDEYKEDVEKEVFGEYEYNKRVYKKRIDTLGYGNVVNDEDTYIKDEVEEELETTNPFPGERVNTPYVIGPDDYHEDESGVFDKETTTYYEGNDVLVTESDEVLEINDTIGRESLQHFGDYESDTVYVRNERLGMDFEVVYSEGCYEPN